MAAMRRQSGRIKVFVVDSSKMDGVGWWRNSEPFTALDKMHGGVLDIRQVGENVDIRELKSADVVVRFRPVTAEAFDFLELAKHLGCKVIIDIDDDLWHVPPTHPAFSDWMKYRDRLHRIYELADAIWTSTEQLRYVVGDLDRTEVMQNAIRPEQLPDAPMEWKSIAAWRGNNSQTSDITNFEVHEEYFKVRDLYEKWIFAGYFPPLRHGDNVQFIPGKQPLAYFLSLKHGLANVFWKPMQDNVFNNSKSNIAWIEATMSGGACVTNYAGKPGWEMAFGEFPTDADEVAETWRKSKEHILENYNLLDVTERRFQSIVKLVK